MKFSLLFSIFCFIPTIFSAQIIEFYKEYITIEIHNGYVEINGVYQLRNPGNSTQEMKLYYPFPIDSMYGEVSDAYAFERMGDTTITRLIAQNEKGAMVDLKVAPMLAKTLYIGYTQKLLSNKSEYILTSTKKWKKPLESSEFELIVPFSYTIDSMTYHPFDTAVSGNKTHYFVRKINFMPEKNFVVWFKNGFGRNK